MLPFDLLEMDEMRLLSWVIELTLVYLVLRLAVAYLRSRAKTSLGAAGKRRNHARNVPAARRSKTNAPTGVGRQRPGLLARQVTTQQSESLGAWLRRYGWSFENGQYVGRLHTGLGVWHAQVDHRDGVFNVLIHDPPRWLFHGHHEPCMVPRGNG